MKRSSWIIAIVTSVCIIGTGLWVLYIGMHDPVWHEVGPIQAWFDRMSLLSMNYLKMLKTLALLSWLCIFIIGRIIRLLQTRDRSLNLSHPWMITFIAMAAVVALVSPALQLAVWCTGDDYFSMKFPALANLCWDDITLYYFFYAPIVCTLVYGFIVGPIEEAKRLPAQQRVKPGKVERRSAWWSVLFTLLLSVLVLLPCYAAQNKRENRYREEVKQRYSIYREHRAHEVDSMTLVWKKEAAVRDSIERIRKAEQQVRDSIEQQKLIRMIRNSRPYRTGSSIYDEDSRKHRRKHPGTHPDDGMFNFDPWDDEDDAYDIERMMVETDPPSFK